MDQKYSPKKLAASKFSAVCIHHFYETDVIRTEKLKNHRGDWEDVPKKKLELKNDAVPRIFNNVPKYLAKKEEKPRTSPEDRKQKIYERVQQESEMWLQADIVSNFQIFKNAVISGEKNNTWEPDWDVQVKLDQIYFYIFMFTDNDVKVDKCFVIDKNMVCTITIRNNRLSTESLSWVLPGNCKISRWSQLENILTRYKKKNYDDDSSDFRIRLP